MVTVQLNASCRLSKYDLFHYMMYFFSLSLEYIIFITLTFYGLNSTLNNFVVFSIFIIIKVYHSLNGRLRWLIYSKKLKRILLQKNLDIYFNSLYYVYVLENTKVEYDCICYVKSFLLFCGDLYYIFYWGY